VKILDEVQCSHLLIKYAGSSNPVSRRTNEAATLTKDQALAELKKWEQDIRAGKVSLADAARKRSDCASFEDGGDLGMVERAFLEKPFADAAFALAVGELSGPVETPAGLHLILRTK